MEQVEVLAKIVDDTIRSGEPSLASEVKVHRRSAGADAPNPEHLSKDLDQIESQMNSGQSDANQTSWLRDRLGLLASRVEWVVNDESRSFLKDRIRLLMDRTKENL
jgi:hypothetical protein